MWVEHRDGILVEFRVASLGGVGWGEDRLEVDVLLHLLGGARHVHRNRLSGARDVEAREQEVSRELGRLEHVVLFRVQGFRVQGSNMLFRRPTTQLSLAGDACHLYQESATPRTHFAKSQMQGTRSEAREQEVGGKLRRLEHVVLRRSSV